MPLNGMFMKEPSNFCCSQRPPRTHSLTDLPTDSAGGAPAGEPRRPVEGDGEETRGQRLPAGVAGVGRAEDEERGVVEEGVKADRPPDVAGADDGEGEEEAEQADAQRVGGRLVRLGE